MAIFFFFFFTTAAQMERLHPVVSYVMAIATMVVYVSWIQKQIHLFVCEYSDGSASHYI